MALEILEKSGGRALSNGNMITKGEGSNFWRYSWDQKNRLTEASTRKQKVRYRYDALGRRIERNLGLGKERTKFTYDGLDVVLDDNDGVLTKYQNGPGIDNKLKLTSGGVSKYFLQDHLGSTVGLADATGAISEQTSYDSFGNPTTALSTRYQYTEREFDNFTGLQFSRARWYDPKLGRFISEDPIGFGGGDVNLFGYVLNNPTNWRDPHGQDVWSIGVGGSGGIGAGSGVAASGSTTYGISGPGIFSDGDFDMGTASSVGALISDGSPCPKGEVWGFGGGITFSVAGSNARNFHDLQGPFRSHFIGLGPLSIQIDAGTADDGKPINVFQIGISPPPLSIGRFGYARYDTYTPPSSVGTVKGLGANLAGSINDLFGGRYRH